MAPDVAATGRHLHAGTARGLFSAYVNEPDNSLIASFSRFFSSDDDDAREFGQLDCGVEWTH